VVHEERLFPAAAAAGWQPEAYQQIAAQSDLPKTYSTTKLHTETTSSSEDKQRM
jgi:hypothetical protein